MTNVTLKAVCKDGDFSTKFEPAALHTHKDFENAKHNISQWLDKVEAFNHVADHEKQQAPRQSNKVRIDLPDSMAKALSDVCKKFYFQWHREPDSVGQYEPIDIHFSVQEMTARIEIKIHDNVNDKYSKIVFRIYRKQVTFNNQMTRSVMMEMNGAHIAVRLLNSEDGSERRIMSIVKNHILLAVATIS